MTRNVDLLIIGSGPAGMSAAVRACEFGLAVLVVDDQPSPGGQIWRAVETVAATRAGELLGEEYREGAALAKAFRASGAAYEPGTQVWQIEPGWDVFMSRANQAEQIRASHVLLATGAQERPVPFPGWTLPGVLTVGAAQILLKASRQIPSGSVWVAGSGPLALAYMTQLLRAGGRIAGWLDTTPARGWQRALRHVGRACAGWKDIVKGLRWMRELHGAGVPVIHQVADLRAVGNGRVEHIEYRVAGASMQRVAAELLLVHEGIVPSIHITQALGCKHVWRDDQACLVPQVDEWGQTSLPGMFAAGDGVGIGGAKAACIRGDLAALGIAACAGRLSQDQARRIAMPLRRRLAVHLSTRPMLDAIYRPRPEIFAPADETIVCRCEELTAGQIREAAENGASNSDQLKAMIRAGMGPCQGRQCGYTVTHILAAAHKQPVADVGFYHIRPPLKPLTLIELASLDAESKAL